MDPTHFRQKLESFVSEVPNGMNPTPLEGALPGEELVRQGLADLEQQRGTDFSLLVLIAAPRLSRLGLPVPQQPCVRPYELELYERLDQRLGAGAHSYYNSLIRRIVSYAQALEREQKRL